MNTIFGVLPDWFSTFLIWFNVTLFVIDIVAFSACQVLYKKAIEKIYHKFPVYQFEEYGRFTMGQIADGAQEKVFKRKTALIVCKIKFGLLAILQISIGYFIAIDGFRKLLTWSW